MPEDSIVAEVRKARREIFEEAGCDLGELARRLNERARAKGRELIDRSDTRERPKRPAPESGE